jgi:methylphosphotriester-DNA--protein-cysteine methyltransferase
MTQAVCIRCANRKAAGYRKCTRCGLDPRGEDLVKSVYLSVDRFEDGTDRKRYAKELDPVAVDLERGQQPFYIEAELARLRKQKATLEQSDVSTSRMLYGLYLIFRPAIIGFAILVCAYFLIRLVGHLLRG